MRITDIVEISTKVGKVQKILPPMDTEIPFTGEIYISNMKTGVINAWKKSEKNNQNLYILQGAVWIVTAEKSNDLSFQIKYEFFEADVPQRITIPKKIYYGFLAVGLIDCRILNILGSSYDEETVTSLKTNEIDFDWAGLKR